MNSKPNTSSNNLHKPPLINNKVKATVTYVPQKTNPVLKTTGQYQIPTGSRPTSHVVPAQKNIKIIHPVKPAFQVDRKIINTKTLIEEPFDRNLQKKKAKQKLEKIVDVCN